MPNLLAQRAKEAGVVGAGGAGFPTHVKVSATADLVIANGAECEPLLRVDQQLMNCCAAELVQGLELLREAVGAGQGVIALKKKYRAAADALRREIEKRRLPVKLFLMDSYYPAGDEHVLVFDACERIVPEGGIPLDVGVVVSNVGTLINLFHAARGRPVTRRVLTVAGEVGSPRTVNAPVGALVEDLIAAAGGARVGDYAVLEGGPIMGEISRGMIAKTTTGLIVLPRDHKQVLYKQRSPEIDVKKASWACDQCRYCTDYCPRYLIGHAIEPHVIMRTVGQQGWENIPPRDLARAYLCCQCGVCGMFACPTSLCPDRVIKTLVASLKTNGAENPHRRSALTPHPFGDGRRVPNERFSRRIDVARYDRPAPLDPEPLAVSRVRIPLKQHVGAPCLPLVKPGQRVKEGDKIGEVPDGALGAPVHASIAGRVEFVTADSIAIKA